MSEEKMYAVLAHDGEVAAGILHGPYLSLERACERAAEWAASGACAHAVVLALSEAAAFHARTESQEGD